MCNNNNKNNGVLNNSNFHKATKPYFILQTTQGHEKLICSTRTDNFDTCPQNGSPEPL